MRSKVCIPPGRFWILWLPVFLFLAAGIGAQEEGARIYYVMGNDFVLTVNGMRNIVTVADMNAAGIALNRSDMIQTGAGVSLELQLIPSGTVIKVAENTSLVYNGFDANGRFTDLGLLYGRIRLVTGTGLGEKTVVLRAGNISVRMNEGDMGADFAIDPAFHLGQAAALPQLTLYNFRGSAEAHPFIGGNDTLKPLPLTKAESLSLEINPPFIYSGRRPLEEDIIGFWKRNNFIGYPPLPMPDTTLPELFPVMAQQAPAEPVPVVEIPVVVELEPQAEDLDLGGWQAEMNWYKKAYRHKTAFLVAGFALTVIGVGAQTYAYTQFDGERDSLARTIYYSSYGSIGLGLLSFLAGTLYNPLVPLD
jgi:hypothetical protein